MPALASPWTGTVRVDPKLGMIHDFRDAVQKLGYAVERAEVAAVNGLANCLEGSLSEALHGTKRAA
jgi:hypothetical protein